MVRTQLSWMFPACFVGFFAAAQPAAKELPLVSVGFGLTQFSGDVGRTTNTGGAFRTSLRLGVEQRFGNWIGAEVFGQFGKISKGERSLTLNRNFESQFLFIGINGIFYFDNDVIIKRNAPFVPYLSAGFGWMSFDPHGDLKDKNDSSYNYWSDGSIHTRPESDPLAVNSSSINRDYTYETQLKDSTTNYTRSTFGIPLSAGFRWKFGSHAGVNIQASYFLTLTDYLDNVKEGGNDSWLYYGVSVYYKFGKESREKESVQDMQAFLKEDFDKDGIPDINDKCQGTPANVKVDNNGCPLDDDNDGVADYLDKEPNTKHGSIVDVNGVTLNYENIRTQAEHDSINEVQKTQFGQNPSLETLKQGNEDIVVKSGPDCIPEEFRSADFNADCVITADEINTVIDNFFDGIGSWTADSINKLIDYFFDQ
ncbi:hypothetical protein BH11BAC2_BH11BAC2_18660 [soil metagenome]